MAPPYYYFGAVPGVVDLDGWPVVDPANSEVGHLAGNMADRVCP